MSASEPPAMASASAQEPALTHDNDATGSAPQSPTDQGAMYPSYTTPAPLPLFPERRKQADVDAAAAAMRSLAIGESEMDALVTRGGLKQQAQLSERPSQPEPMPTAEEVFRFILAGKSGSGKSTTGNTIPGEEEFKVSMTFLSSPATCDDAIVDRDGKVIEIKDFPILKRLSDKTKSQAKFFHNLVFP